MTPTEFLTDTENHIYKEVAKYTNLLLGKKKTNSLSTGLFLNLPIEVALEQVPNPQPKLLKELKSFMPFFSAYTKMGDSTKVYFTFLYHDAHDLKAITNHLHRHSIFFAFVYLHEVQHVLRKHITHTYNKLMTNIAHDVLNPHQLINIAEDHAINYSLKDLFTVSSLSSKWNEIEAIGCYNTEYHEQQLSDIDILKDLMANSEQPTISQLSDAFDTIEMDGKSTTQPNAATVGDGTDEDRSGDGKSDKCNTLSDDSDKSATDLADSLREVLSTNLRGTTAGDLFEAAFEAVKVETGWFKKVKASFKRQVYYKTHDYTTSWANLNNTYRRIYKAPKKQFIDDKINIILASDQSGSMNTVDLQKLLYLVESESKRIGSLTVLLHDTAITHTFTINDEYDITKNPDFAKALACRYSAGGTSHSCVFQAITDMKLPDPAKVIFIAFSDMYSDIENTVKNYPIMRKLTAYWVSPEAHNVGPGVPGTRINMQ